MSDESDKKKSGRHPQPKNLDDWLALMPKEWEGLASEAWHEGARMFRKIIVKTGERKELPNGEVEVTAGKTVGNSMPLAYPAIVPSDCELILSYSVNGRQWSHHVPGPTIDGNDLKGMVAMFSNMANLSEERRNYFIRVGMKIIENHLPAWIAHGTDPEKERADAINEFLAFASDYINDAKILAGVFYAGISYERMSNMHIVSPSSSEDGLAVIIRHGLKTHGESCGFEELLRHMGAKMCKGTNERVFPDGSVFSNISLQKAFSNVRKKK